MNINDLKEMDNTLITEDQLEEIELSEFVSEVGNLGSSSQYPGATWLDVQLTDGDNINVFVKY
ncbi:hypothetical protein [Aminipila sp.]|uniref:hypothetical protein n=1 Tax=Aminipila sp. TaxID=2060095 RepID=UPI00289F1CB8|nr:hypothetical protein [Aminipila sp.]